MSSVVALDRLLDTRRVWRGQPAVAAPSGQPTGFVALDQALPGGGWPEAALSEILFAAHGVCELRLLWPTLSRLTAHQQERVVLVDPPHIPYPPAWLQAGIDLRQLTVIQATGQQALWATEQCLRSGSCGAVLCWLQDAPDRVLRRLQVAAQSGATPVFAYRPLQVANQPSPAALRLSVEGQPPQVNVFKCRGGRVPSRPIALDL